MSACPFWEMTLLANVCRFSQAETFEDCFVSIQNGFSLSDFMFDGCYVIKASSFKRIKITKRVEQRRERELVVKLPHFSTSKWILKYAFTTFQFWEAARSRH